MLRFPALALTTLLTLSACATTEPALGPDGKPLPRVYNIKSGQEGAIQFRMLDSMNSLRSAAGAAPLQMNAELTAAAATHARDMAVQNRPWHFGSDGSSPIDRTKRAGYIGRFLGENISETHETELETLSAWMAVTSTREVILDPMARYMGFAWYQEPSGKIWWTLVTGG